MDERVQLYLAHLWMIHVWLSIINCGEITIHGPGPLILAGIMCRHCPVFAVFFKAMVNVIIKQFIKAIILSEVTLASCCSAGMSQQTVWSVWTNCTLIPPRV